MPLPASYATVGDVLERYPPIGSVAAISSAHIVTAIAAEQALVDGRLAVVYPGCVPFAAVPPMIQAITADLATLRILKTRTVTPPSKDEEGQWLAPFERSAKLLDGLAAGSLSLVSGSGTLFAQTGDGVAWSNVSTSTPTFIGQDFDLVYPPDEYFRQS